MRISLAKYGVKEIVISGIIAVVASIGLVITGFPWLIIIPLILFGFILYFFRDPERVIPPDEQILVAPADGRVIEITEVSEDKFLKEKALKISIFLSLFDVHINRAPLSGKVGWQNYTKGKFLVASNPLASARNECNEVGLISGNGGVKILLRQVAGIIARRIVCACAVNDSLTKGGRIGMIKFGSRTELYIPLRVVETVLVKLNDKTRGGATPLVKIKDIL